MSAIVFLNGIQLPSDEVEGTRSLTINITVEDERNGRQSKAMSGELTFYGSAYAAIKAAIIDDPGGKMVDLPLDIYEDCSTPNILVFRGVLKGNTVGWCDDGCSCTGTAVEKTEQTDAMDCIMSTLIADNRNGFRSQQHPRMSYCDDPRPGAMHQTLLILGAILKTIMLALTPVVIIMTVIVSVINLIIDAVNVLPGVNIDHIDFDGDSSTNLLDEWQNLQTKLELNMIGCARKHPSPLVRSYILNVCSICNLNFQSSVLNTPGNPYYNSVLFSAPVMEGSKDGSTTYIDDNEPIKTLDVFLDELADVFNAGWRIQGTILRFERIDQLPPSAPWIDLDTLKAQKRLIGDVCYNWQTEDIPAFAMIGFMQDMSDGVGNEARKRYEHVFEWNNPFNPAQRGEQRLTFQYGMLRQRNDGGPDGLKGWEQAPLNFYYPSIASTTQYIQLMRGTASMPKLLIWDGNMSNGRVVNFNADYQVNETGVAPLTVYPPNQPGMGL